MIEVMLNGQVLGISALCIWGLLLLGYHTLYRGIGLLFSVNSHSRSVPSPTPNITNPCYIIRNIVCSFVVTT